MDDSDFRWRQIIIPAFGPSMLFGLGKGAVLPVIALTAIDLGASQAVSGLIVALIGLGSLVSNIPAALVTARFGERRSLIGASALSILAMALCLLADHPTVLALGVLMLGVSTSVFYLARQTYMIEAVPVRLRARAFSTLGGTQRIGMFAGPFVAAASMHFFGLPGAYWVAIIALLATGVLSFAIPELQVLKGGQNVNAQRAAAQHGPASPGDTARPSNRSDASAKTTRPAKIKMWDVARRHYRVLLSLGSGVMLIGAMRASRQIAIPLWAEHIGLSPTATAVIFGLVSAIDVLVFYPAGKIMDEYGRLWVAMPCALLLGLSLAAIPFTYQMVPFVLVCTLMGLGNGIGSGIVMTLGADASPEVGRTQFLGLWRLIGDMGTSAGPFFLSGVTALVSLGAGILAVGLLGFAAAAIFWRGLPHIRPEGSETAA